MVSASRWIQTLATAAGGYNEEPETNLDCTSENRQLPKNSNRLRKISLALRASGILDQGQLSQTAPLSRSNATQQNNPGNMFLNGTRISIS